MCRAAFPSCGIPPGRAAHGLGVFSERQWRGGMAAFFDFLSYDIGCGAALRKSAAVAPAKARTEPPAFRNAEFHRTPAVKRQGGNRPFPAAVSQGVCRRAGAKRQTPEMPGRVDGVKIQLRSARRRNAGRLSAAKRQRAIQCPRDADTTENRELVFFRTGGRCAGQ